MMSGDQPFADGHSDSSVVRNSEPLVEALVVGQPSVVTAEMPLAVIAGGVASVRECLANGHFPLRESVGHTAKRHRMRAGADRPASRHETGTAGSALRLHVHVEEAQAALGKTVNARCRCAARQAAAVAADFPVAQIVGQDEDDVGFVSGLCRRGDR